MMRRAGLAAACMAACITGSASAQSVTSAGGGEVRVLDKLTGEVTDLTMRNGEAQQSGLLLLTMTDCRYPSSNPSGDAYAALTVTYRNEETPAFHGWMIASAPALNAMDHPRYDVWVLRCTTS